MNYIDETFERMNLQQIKEFLLYGSECVEIEKGSYVERLYYSDEKLLIMQKKVTCHL